MTGWPLNREGFVTAWAVTGPEVTPFHSDKRDPNQLRYEASLRAEIAGHEPVEGAGEVRMDAPSRLGLLWRPLCGEDAAFVNLSDFYSLMQKVRFDAATLLIADRDREVKAVIWSWCAADLYLNGVRIGGIRQPMYKPIQRQELTLRLRPGANLVYLACETLGVRDTRSVAGLQLKDAEGVKAALPDKALSEQAFAADAFLSGARLEADVLRLPGPAPEGAQWHCPHPEADFARVRPPRWLKVSGEAIPLPEGEALITLRLPVGGGWLARTWEAACRVQPEYSPPGLSFEENRRFVLERIAAVETLSRGEKFGFPISNMLARKYLGDTSKDDRRLMRELLDLIESRVDCSDFLMAGLLRYLHCYPVSPEEGKRIREVMLNWRYWMDQDGFDGMCFWSENHCLMFYSAAMLAGERYPEETFTRAGMKGRELSAWGRSKVLDWLDDVERWGFEEFLSGVYMCVTFAALINVVDFAEPEISARAGKITDRLLENIALHTFRGGLIAPQGRVYRGVLYPFAAGAMALMNLADPAQPYAFGEGWLGFWAASGYRLPDSLKGLMASPASTSYVTGNARIVLEKREDWCLTSVQSPREPFERWPNESLRPDADPATHAFVKGYNECFHGTTCFQPGVSGYQQHLWYAALDGAAILPAVTREKPRGSPVIAR